MGGATAGFLLWEETGQNPKVEPELGSFSHVPSLDVGSQHDLIKPGLVSKGTNLQPQGLYR